MAAYLNLDLSTMSACMEGKMAAPPNANMIDPKAVKNPWVVGVLWGGPFQERWLWSHPARSCVGTCPSLTSIGNRTMQMMQTVVVVIKAIAAICLKMGNGLKWIEVLRQLLWRPIKMRVSHQNESCLSCPHPPSSYEGGREQVGSSHFDEKLSFW